MVFAYTSSDRTDTMLIAFDPRGEALGPPVRLSAGITVGEHFNRSSLHIGEYESLKKDALDAYTFFRDAYEQNREAKIKE